MKDYLMKSLKRTLIIVAVFLVVAFVVIFVMYNSDPSGFPDRLEEYSKRLTQITADLYGNKKVSDNIELPEKESLEEAQNYYYFQQLDENGKKIYITIENSIDKIINGEDSIPLPASINQYAKEHGKDGIEKSFQDAWDAFMTDKCEYFYLDSSKVCLLTKTTTLGKNTNYEFFIGKGDNATYFIEGINTKEQIEQRKKELDRVADKIINGASGNNYQKLKYVHDYIIENTEYGSVNSVNGSNVYGCLVRGDAICEGYARAFKYLLDKMDIPCILVAGDAIDDKGKTERHAWNYVFINNNWYAIDVTWDDPVIIGNGRVTDEIKYRYFLKGKSTMKKDHTCIGQITKEGKIFEYPVLADEDLID